MPATPALPTLVAHRGWPLRFPENSLDGIRAALAAGACFLEFDVQICGDRVPVVIHDNNTLRTSGVDLGVLDAPLSQLRRIPVGEPAKFGQAFADARISTLEEMVAVLAEWPRARAFVEIKRASLRRFGVQPVVAAVMQALATSPDQCVVISFDREAVAAARQAGAKRTGWAFEKWSDEQREQAMQLAPDYLFCKVNALPLQRELLWPGPWTWAAYETDDPAQALELAARGIELVETDNIGEMLRHPLLKERACGHD